MAATVVLSETNGAGATVTDGISNINFGSQDAPNLTPSSAKIIQGLNSYCKFIRIKVSSMGGSSTIDTLKVWKSAGSYVTGEAIQSNTDDVSGGRYLRTAYSAPDRTPSVTNETHQLNVGLAAPTGANLSISAAGTANDAGVDTPAGTITVDGSYSQYWTLIMKTTTSTPAGAVNQKTFTYRWNEA